MIYIQLSLPYRDFDKVTIKSIYIYETSIAVNYSICNDNTCLFDKTFHINEDLPEYNSFKTALPIIEFSVVDNIHKLLLEYMIEKNIETGTLEVK